MISTLCGHWVVYRSICTVLFFVTVNVCGTFTTSSSSSSHF